jgi:hypothetical protein
VSGIWIEDELGVEEVQRVLRHCSHVVGHFPAGEAHSRVIEGDHRTVFGKAIEQGRVLIVHRATKVLEEDQRGPRWVAETPISKAHLPDMHKACGSGLGTLWLCFLVLLCHYLVLSFCEEREPLRPTCRCHFRHQRLQLVLDEARHLGDLLTLILASSETKLSQARKVLLCSSSYTTTRGDRVKSLCRGSAEREDKRLHARIEKLDLELPISNGLRLPDQLIQPLFGHRAVALLVNVTAVRRLRRPSIEEHANAYGRSPRCRAHDQMQIAGVKTVCDAPVGRVQHRGLSPHRPLTR